MKCPDQPCNCEECERCEVALRFAVAAYGGLLADLKVRAVRCDAVAKDAFEMADAFIARRDGAS